MSAANRVRATPLHMKGANGKRGGSNRPALTLSQIRSLRTRETREQTGLFFAEGIRFLAEAVHHRHAIQTLVVSPSLLTNALGRSLVRRLRHAGVPCLEVSASEFRSLALTDPPQGVGLVVRQRWEGLARIRTGSELCWVALESVRSPGNLGSIIRTCEAVGAAGVILVGDAIDPFDPVTVLASMGAIFPQRLVRATTAQLAVWKQRHSVTLVGTSPGASVDYRDAVYHRPLALLMGGERKGMPVQLQSLCDVMVTIPMVGCADSLNLAAATAVMLYEAFSQRHRG